MQALHIATNTVIHRGRVSEKADLSLLIFDPGHLIFLRVLDGEYKSAVVFVRRSDERWMLNLVRFWIVGHWIVAPVLRSSLRSHLLSRTEPLLLEFGK
jgi:hypothetical protein